MERSEPEVVVTHARFLATAHFASLDGVRCASILAVLWHHSDHAFAGGAWAGRGFLGVDMFFVLSGFLIVTLLLRERDRSGAISLRAFYVRRTLRIFPIYYGLLGAMTLAYAIGKPGDPDTGVLLVRLPIYLLYLGNFLSVHAHNLGPTWSLASEEQFYLLWPAIERIVKGRAIYVLLGVVILANQAVSFGLVDPIIDAIYGGPPHPEVFDVTFTPIALGVLLAHALHDPRSFARLGAVLGHRWAFAAASSSLIILVAFAPADISGWPRLLIQLAMAALLGSLVVREDRPITRVLGWGPIARIGAVSYGMYLFHLFVRHGALTVMSSAGLDGIHGLDFILTAAGTYAVAELSYRFYEKRFLALKERFA